MMRFVQSVEYAFRMIYANWTEKFMSVEQSSNKKWTRDSRSFLVLLFFLFRFSSNLFLL